MMRRDFKLKKLIFTICVLIPVIVLTLGAASSSEKPSQAENEEFRQAVEAVKNKNYSEAILLFEAQAKKARHDAQYNLAVLLSAGKGRPRNYSDALFWAWLAQLGNIEAAKDLANDVFGRLPEKHVDEIRKRVQESLQARIDVNDRQAIPQFADFHLSILEEPDHINAYIWYSIAAALNIPDANLLRDDVETELEEKELVEAQTTTQELFDKYKFKPLIEPIGGEKNDN